MNSKPLDHNESSSSQCRLLLLLLIKVAQKHVFLTPAQPEASIMHKFITKATQLNNRFTQRYFYMQLGILGLPEVVLSTCISDSEAHRPYYNRSILNKWSTNSLDIEKNTIQLTLRFDFDMILFGSSEFYLEFFQQGVCKLL